MLILQQGVFIVAPLVGAPLVGAAIVGVAAGLLFGRSHGPVSLEEATEA